MLSNEQVKSIRASVVEGKKQCDLAKEFGVSRSTISDIATGRIYKDVSWPNARPFDPTNDRIQELEAEVVHLKAEKSTQVAKVKAAAKTTGLFNAVVKEMDKRITPFAALPSSYVPSGKKTISEHVVLHISDMHADQVIKPESVGGLEKYDFPVACARAERIVNTTLEWTQQTLAPKFNFPTLWILSYGDQTSGTIHKAAERSYFRNQFRNCLAIGQLQGLMIRDLAPAFERVNVVCLSGNHGRLTPKKDYPAPLENFDYLVSEIARSHCKDIPNVSFLIPDAWSVNLNINGVGFSVSHGDDVKGNGGIPFYGMVRRQKGLIAINNLQGGLRTRYFCMGHHHVAASLADMDGELLVNGAWTGTDPYAYNALSGYREPSQLLHGVNPEYGVTWRLPIKIRTKNEVPKRYLIDGGREVAPA